jgi:hypothetical protein
MLGIGMVLVVAGVVVAGLFMPGTWILVLGFVVLAAAGVLRVAQRTRPEDARTSRG